MQKILTGMVLLALVALFVALSQPAWRGKAMVEEYTSDCAKRGGVLLEHVKTFGTTYECTSWLGGAK